MLRLFYVAFGADRWTWQPMMWVVAILTMVVGAALAVVQSDMKRMLAYSSVAHTGFLLTGVLGVQTRRPTSPTASSPRCRRCCSTSSPTASRCSARSPS